MLRKERLNGENHISGETIKVEKIKETVVVNVIEKALDVKGEHGHNGRSGDSKVRMNEMKGI